MILDCLHDEAVLVAPGVKVILVTVGGDVGKADDAIMTPSKYANKVLLLCPIPETDPLVIVGEPCHSPCT